MGIPIPMEKKVISEDSNLLKPSVPPLSLPSPPRPPRIERIHYALAPLADFSMQIVVVQDLSIL